MSAHKICSVERLSCELPVSRLRSFGGGAVRVCVCVLELACVCVRACACAFVRACVLGLPAHKPE
jgi:hypothetical protein